MTIKITEGEITSWCMKFLRRNSFKIFSSSKSGQKLYYRYEISNPPKYKQPDIVAIKNNVIIMFENKIYFKDMFKKNSLGMSDIDKLKSFFLNDYAVKEFKHKAEEIFEINCSKLILIPACCSFFSKKNLDNLPKNFTYIGIVKNKETINVSLGQSKDSSLFRCHSIKFAATD